MSSSVIVEDESERLNEDISSLKAQVASLKRKLKVESSTILTATSTHNALRTSRAPSQKKLLDQYAKQQAHNQQGMYRGTTPVTAFKVLDPDPNAVDGGHVLGLRFENMSRGQFGLPYFVMLNRSFPDSRHLRVHRHTIPPAVPLAGLAARYLPSPKSGDEGEEAPAQDLERFVRALRRDIMRYQNRMGVAADLRRGLGLHEMVQDVEDDSIIGVGLADIEAKQIELTWADERSGRLVMDDDGKVRKLVVFGKQGRDWETMRRLGAVDEHIDVVVENLQQPPMD